VKRIGWLGALLVGVCVGGATPAWATEYRVRSGDTLGEIAQRFGVTVEELQRANGLTSDLIVVGQVLDIPDDDAPSAAAPSGASTATYTVRSGDTLAEIASTHRVSLSDLKAANGLSSDLIHPGQRLRIPGGSGVTATPASTGTLARRWPAMQASQAQLEVLARIVKGECPPNVPYAGKVAVAAVVLNRVRSSWFPNSIAGVAHQPRQFSCYNANERQRLYYGTIPDFAWEAAREALAGADPTGGSTHYFNPYVVQPSWARRMTFVLRIGTTRTTTHDFYRPRNIDIPTVHASMVGAAGRIGGISE